MLRLTRVLAVLTLATAVGTSAASAQVANSTDVGGYRTFQDVNTGRVWLDLNNFFGMSANQMFLAAINAGFTVANLGDINQLFSGLPLGSGQWSSYAPIMGSAPNRPLIWGAYLDANSSAGWAYAFEGMTFWQIDAGIDPDEVPNQGTADADMNVWAFQPAVVATPEPGSLMLLASGLAGLGGFARRRYRRS
jgi:hypothetical protein